jgi:hypothetical protein
MKGFHCGPTFSLFGRDVVYFLHNPFGPLHRSSDHRPTTWAAARRVLAVISGLESVLTALGSADETCGLRHRKATALAAALPSPSSIAP